MRFIIVLFLLFSANAHAGALEEKTRKLFEVQGVVRDFQEMIDQGKTQAQEETKRTFDQMLTQLNPNKEFRDRISAASNKYLKSMLGNRTADEIVNVLIQNYAPNFTEQELDKLIDFYGSSVGKKDAVVSKAAMQKVADYYKVDNERIRAAATNEFIKDIQGIARECGCAKPRKNNSAPTADMSPPRAPSTNDLHLAMNSTQPIWYELRNAIHAGDFAQADSLLKSYPALISMKNGIGETVLYFLAVENDLRGVEWLILKGADLNSTNEFGEPLLFEVAQLEYKALFIWLVKHGANPKATNHSGQTIEESLLELDKKKMAAWILKNGA